VLAEPSDELPSEVDPELETAGAACYVSLDETRERNALATSRLHRLFQLLAHSAVARGRVGWNRPNCEHNTLPAAKQHRR
jgi:hypothetical protein